MFLILTVLILVGLSLNNLFLDEEFIYDIFEMIYEPTPEMVAPGVDASDVVLEPLPSIYDEKYGMFRIWILALGMIRYISGGLFCRILNIWKNKINRYAFRFLFKKYEVN